jgi:hypothetical protein
MLLRTLLQECMQFLFEVEHGILDRGDLLVRSRGCWERSGQWLWFKCGVELRLDSVIVLLQTTYHILISNPLSIPEKGNSATAALDH